MNAECHRQDMEVANYCETKTFLVLCLFMGLVDNIGKTQGNASLILHDVPGGTHKYFQRHDVTFQGISTL